MTSKTDASKASDALKRLEPVPTSTRHQQQVIIETPEISKTTEDVTKNTTVTTSVRREIKETRILPPILDSFKAGFKKEESAIDESSRGKRTEQTSALIAKVPGLNPQNPPKSILVRDISDIYLTTTVETEFKELTTKVSKDTIQHTKPKEVHPKIEPPKEKALPPPKSPVVRKIPLPKQSWNVIIRQREPPVSPTGGTTDLDASIESNADTTEEEKPVSKPHFDVKISSTPPNQSQPKNSNEMVSIPPLEMPATVSVLREALKPSKPEGNVPEKATAQIKGQEETVSDPSEDNRNRLPPRTVRWKDGKQPSEGAPSTGSSTESFQSSESLRERSSSEVLEIAPTLPSQPPPSKGRSMLERSTSEIVAYPEDHSKWVGGVVPVLESLSPEFLANIPVVIQGGFFNRQRPPDKIENTKDT